MKLVPTDSKDCATGGFLSEAEVNSLFSWCPQIQLHFLHLTISAGASYVLAFTTGLFKKPHATQLFDLAETYPNRLLLMRF